MSDGALKTPLMSSDAASGDPYFVFRDGLDKRLTSIKKQYEMWRAGVDNGTAKAAAASNALKGLKRSVVEAERDLRDLEATVTMVERQRQRFTHIDDGELDSRKGHVAGVRAELGRISRELASTATQDKIRELEKAEGAKRGPGGGDSGRSDFEQRHGEFIGTARQQQETLRDQEHEHLEDIERGLSRLGEAATAINYELRDQGGLLDELAEDVDEAQGAMDRVTGAIGKLLKTKDNCQICTVFWLVIVLCVLTVLVFTI